MQKGMPVETVCIGRLRVEVVDGETERRSERSMIVNVTEDGIVLPHGAEDAVLAWLRME